MISAGFLFLLMLLLLAIHSADAAAAAAAADAAVSSMTTSPVINWDSAWTASSIQGTVIAVPCKAEDHDTSNALLVVLHHASSSLATPPFTLLDRAFVAWTGFAVDVETLTNQLLQYTDDRISIYNQGPPNVAAFLASSVRKEAVYNSGRPFAVQALVVQRQRVWTIDPSGACTLWNAGATALGREASVVRKQLHAALQAHGSVPSMKQALRIAIQALPDGATQKHAPQAFLLCEEADQTADTLSVQRIDPDLILQQLQSANEKGE